MGCPVEQETKQSEKRLEKPEDKKGNPDLKLKKNADSDKAAKVTVKKDPEPKNAGGKKQESMGKKQESTGKSQESPSKKQDSSGKN